MVSHSDYYAVASPPQLTGVCHAVVVLNDRVGGQVKAQAAAPPIVRLSQPVDLKRFGSRGASARHPRRVLLLGNYLRGMEGERIADACRAAGLEPVARGVHDDVTTAAEREIADADVVIGPGRCIVEAMAGRRAAYVYGIVGGDGWVTPETYAALEADGFAGLALPEPVDPARLTRDLAAWTPDMGTANRHLASQHHDVGRHAAALVSVLTHEGTERTADVSSAAELARLVRVEWQTWSHAAGLLGENQAQRERARIAEDAAAAAIEATAVRDAMLEQERAERAAERVAWDAERQAWHAEREAWDAERQAWARLLAQRRMRVGLALAAPIDRARRIVRRLRRSRPGHG